MLEINLSSLESFASGIDEVIDDISDFNAGFLIDEFDIFCEKIMPITPVDTGQMQHSYQSSYVRKQGDTVEADWSNEALHSSLANDGNIFTLPKKFWQKGRYLAEMGREKRYQRRFKKRFNESIHKAILGGEK